jgi:hypothetical protein
MNLCFETIQTKLRLRNHKNRRYMQYFKINSSKFSHKDAPPFLEDFQ